MSQEYFPGESASSSGEGSSRHVPEEPQRENPFYSRPAPPPNFMTVGNGATPASAEALMSSLNRDSGYGSMASGSAFGGDTDGWASMMEDRPMPMHTPGQLHSTIDHERQAAASHIHQLL